MDRHFKTSLPGWVPAFLLVVAACGCAEPQHGSRAEEKTGAVGCYERSSERRAGKVWHTVVEGETLWEIGRAYGVPWREIAEANNIQDVTEFRAGMKLVIPGAKMPPELKWLKSKVD